VALDAHAFGYDPDPAGAEAFASTLPRPTLAQAGPDLVADGKTETHLWPALLQCSPGWKRGSQGMVGSCVGWGASLAVDLTGACDIVYRCEPEVWRGRTIESSLYGFSRVEARGKTVNNGGDGSTGFHAAKAIREFGCLHYGVEYGSVVIAESGKQDRDRSWGRNGVPNELEPYAKERRCSEVTLAVDFEQAAAAIQNGYPVVVCSGQGFSMSRDADGFCKPGGTWWHCMAFAAVRWGKRPGLLCVNSWGDSNTVGKHYPENMPTAVRNCSFYVDADVCTRMLSGRDSYVYAGYSGFKRTQIPNWTGDILG
jgi:hypothetical protein